jgi:hypothetical protein
VPGSRTPIPRRTRAGSDPWCYQVVVEHQGLRRIRLV